MRQRRHQCCSYALQLRTACKGFRHAAVAVSVLGGSDLRTATQHLCRRVCRQSRRLARRRRRRRRSRRQGMWTQSGPRMAMPCSSARARCFTPSSCRCLFKCKNQTIEFKPTRCVVPSRCKSAGRNGVETITSAQKKRFVRRSGSWLRCTCGNCPGIAD